MIYSVKECYYTVQGEGAQTGRAAVFLRFAGCNLWNGLERGRQAAVCQFCDTDFVGTDGPGGGKYTTPEALARHVRRFWPGGGVPYVVCTGGEPLLQLDAELIAALKAEGLAVGVETNGTIVAPHGLDWICVSPKADAEIIQRTGDELKLVYPQTKARPDQFESLDFTHFFLQPLDDEQAAKNLSVTLDYVKANPKWRLSLQTHKFIGIP